MLVLVIGVLLFTGVHFIPSLAPGWKAALSRRLSDNGFKGIFSLLLLLSLALIIFGWRSTTPALWYTPSPALHLPALGLIVLGLLIMTASNRNSRIRQWIRHPQLTGVALWGVAHLLLNGENRSVVLFGGLTAWAILEIPAINRREGVWIKSDVPPWQSEIVTVLIAGLTIGLFIFIHPWISGKAVW